MGAVFTQAVGAADVGRASPSAVDAGMHVTFAVAAGLILAALAMMIAGVRRKAA
jgi:hypothetical protein